MSTSILKKRERNRPIIARNNFPNIFEIFEVQSEANRSEANPEIQSLNMFKSGILNIRKVQSESNIKLFEYFGQPTWNYAT